MDDGDLHTRAARYGALGDPVRLAIVDELSRSDRSPVELRRRLGIESNLLAHHLDVLERVGLVSRSRSSGDGRRRYVHLLAAGRALVSGRGRLARQPALFVCTRNSARSQLAAAVWGEVAAAPATSAGSDPAPEVHPGAVAAAARAGLALAGAAPRALAGVAAEERPSLVVTVCDQAHEALAPPDEWLHWSIPDPVAAGTDMAFDATVAELRERIGNLVAGGDLR